MFVLSFLTGSLPHNRRKVVYHKHEMLPDSLILAANDAKGSHAEA
jgi:hypothetical protein